MFHQYLHWNDLNSHPCPDYFVFFAGVTARINIIVDCLSSLITTFSLSPVACFACAALKKLFCFSTASLCFFPFVWSVIEECPLEDNSIVLWHTEQRACVLHSMTLHNQPWKGLPAKYLQNTFDFSYFSFLPYYLWTK